MGQATDAQRELQAEIGHGAELQLDMWAGKGLTPLAGALRLRSGLPIGPHRYVHLSPLGHATAGFVLRAAVLQSSLPRTAHFSPPGIAAAGFFMPPQMDDADRMREL
jgi:hypothetical protein